jgi:DNA polymerase elongation subunit (family B)
VSRAIGIPLELEGVFKWLVFLPNKGTNTGALNRYYGLFDDGKLKVRGIELRKHDTPIIVRKAQTAMFDVLTRAEDSAEFKALIPEAVGVLRDYYLAVRKRECAPEDMIITKRVSRELNEYRVFNDQVAAMMQLKKQGMMIQPGQKLRFVICDSTTKDPGRRVKVAEMMDGHEPYDATKYCNLLLRSGETILAPFGYSEDTLRREMVKYNCPASSGAGA